ncbi:hypothetical protein [Sphingomonas sp.]|uniref:hypothetical protein n=1 Tax=Sphingomonas sp. TaxID=28214 RepID=UPI000DB43A6B|nr:hypothetical protein [Sphingomonas sp.]PZU08517.1 MAG: hypothetical protein DI605_11105 [Sphingomonas sp.]
MQIITDAQSMARAIATALNPWLKHMLALRSIQLLEADIEIGELGPFIIVEPGDGLAAVETAAGIPIATNLVDGAAWPDPDFVPNWEWVRSDHGWREIVFVTSDAGGGAILFVPDREGIDPTLLAIIRAFADRDTAEQP